MSSSLPEWLPSPGAPTLSDLGEMKILERIRQEHQIEVELVKAQQFNPWQISQQDAVIMHLSRACKKVLGCIPDFSGLNGYCEVELLAQAGIPSVVFGPGADSAAHAPDERVAVREVLDAARIYALLAYDFICH